MKVASETYYQVWEHDGQSDRVSVVATYKTRYDAEKKAEVLNGKAKYYSREGCPPFRFFFVQPVLEEHLREPVAEMFHRQLDEDRKLFLEGSHLDMASLANMIVPGMLHAIENSDSYEHFRLTDQGGWKKGCSFKLSPFGTLVCYALYSGNDSVNLVLALENGERVCECTVEAFESEEELMAWLNNKAVAEEAYEAKLIDLFCDRHLIVGQWLVL